MVNMTSKRKGKTARSSEPLPSVRSGSGSTDGVDAGTVECGMTTRTASKIRGSGRNSYASGASRSSSDESASGGASRDSRSEYEICTYCGGECDDPEINPYQWQDDEPYCSEGCYELMHEDRQREDEEDA